MMERRLDFLADYDWIRTGADVRAARPRRDVGLDPLSADARGLRHRDPVHRGLGLPADVRPRHDRHGDDGDRERSDHAARRRAWWSSTRRPAGSSPSTTQRRRLRRQGADHQRAELSCRADIEIDCPGLGELKVDVAYGGNFYAIVEPQKNYARPRDDVGRRHPAAGARSCAKLMNEKIELRPSRGLPASRGVSHMMWTGEPRDARRACPQRRVLRRQGDRPLALRHRHLGAHGAARRQGQAQGRRRFRPREHHRLASSRAASRARRRSAHRGDLPSIAGWARQTGINTIFIDDRDPVRHGTPSLLVSASHSYTEDWRVWAGGNPSTLT